MAAEKNNWIGVLCVLLAVPVAFVAGFVFGEPVSEKKSGVHGIPVLVAEEKLQPYDIYDEKAWTDDGEGTLRREIPAKVIIFDSTTVHIEYDYVNQLFNVYGTGLDKAPEKIITVGHATGVHKVDIWDWPRKGKKMSRLSQKIRGVEIVVRDTALDKQWKFKATTHTDSLSYLTVLTAGQ